MIRPLLAVLAMLLATPVEAEDDPLLGRWLTEDAGGVIEIAPCGDALCGRMVGLVLEPNEAMPVNEQGRSRCGLVIMRDMRPSEPGRWSGQITDPRDGHVYDIALRVDAAGRLRMRGYVLVPLLGATQVWTRVNLTPPPDCRIAPQAMATASGP